MVLKLRLQLPLRPHLLRSAHDLHMRLCTDIRSGLHERNFSAALDHPQSLDLTLERIRPFACECCGEEEMRGIF
jgi:hypothetical protein